VALIQHGRIVEDRTFTDRAKITVGTGEKSTFLVPMAEVPVTTTVFDISRHGTALLFDANTEGRLTVSGAEAPLYKYVDKASQKGARLSLPLPDDAKGRVSIGEVSLLFQFVEPPKRHAPAPLPKGAKGLVAQIDRGFLLVLGVSLAAHFAGVGYLSSQPLPEERDLSVEEFVPDRFARALLPLPKPNKPPEVTKAPEKSPVATETPKATPPKPTEGTNPPKVAARPSGDALKKQLKKMGMLAVIGAVGEDGAFGDVMTSNVGDVAKALREVGADGVKVASVEDATNARRKGEDTGETQDIDLPIGTPGMKRVELTETGPRKPGTPPEVKSEKLVIDTPDIDAKELAKWLNSRKPAIQSCYERQLKRTPTLKGHLEIMFTITPRGRIGEVGFDQDTLHSSAVEQCISGMMRGWVLPFAPEDDVPARLPFIFTPGS
jgi:hypothetical protein